MSVLSWFAGVVGDGARAIYECRRCGTALDGPESECPYCGLTDVVRFEPTE